MPHLRANVAEHGNNCGPHWSWEQTGSQIDRRCAAPLGLAARLVSLEDGAEASANAMRAVAETRILPCCVLVCFRLQNREWLLP